MKKCLFVVLFSLPIAFLISCGGNSDDQQKNTVVEKEVLVNIKGYKDMYVCADEHKGDSVVANRPEAGDWETFKMTYLDSNIVVLKSFKNLYVTADETKGNFLFANRTSYDIWEKFTVVKLDSGRVAFKSNKGLYVSADQYKNKKLIANRPAVGDWEKFKIITVQEKKK
jgi:hypothetical protein